MDALAIPETPAYVYDLNTVRSSAEQIRKLCDAAGCRVLYSLKACAVREVVNALAPSVHGFAASSEFEARLARRVSSGTQGVHLTSPGLSLGDKTWIAGNVDYCSLNSPAQWSRLVQELPGVELGVRVNPGISFVLDSRYDPCRIHSKLGVSLDSLQAWLSEMPAALPSIDGVHFHSNCDSDDLSELVQTVRVVTARIPALLDSVGWINIGGGYSLDGCQSKREKLIEAVRLLRERHNLTVFTEPGAAFVRNSGYLVSTVVDLFESGGSNVAVLDTTVNHWPEVYEYQFEPDVVGHVDGGKYEYVLAGCSCLAGDVFGAYCFDQRLRVGSRIVFADAGAYSLVKAHTFNGICVPAIYTVDENGEFALSTPVTFEDSLSRCEDAHVAT